MNLIGYVHQEAAQKGCGFKRVIEQIFKNLRVEPFQTFNAFKERLKQVSVYGKGIHILLADSKKQLNELTGQP